MGGNAANSTEDSIPSVQCLVPYPGGSRSAMGKLCPI